MGVVGFCAAFLTIFTGCWLCLFVWDLAASNINRSDVTQHRWYNLWQSLFLWCVRSLWFSGEGCHRHPVRNIHQRELQRLSSVGLQLNHHCVSSLGECDVLFASFVALALYTTGCQLDQWGAESRWPYDGPLQCTNHGSGRGGGGGWGKVCIIWFLLVL